MKIICEYVIIMNNPKVPMGFSKQNICDIFLECQWDFQSKNKGVYY